MGKYDQILKDINKQLPGGSYIKTDWSELRRMVSFAEQANRTTYDVGFKSQAKHVKKAKHFAVTGGQGRQPERNPVKIYENSPERAEMQKVLSERMAVAAGEYVKHGRGAPSVPINQVFKSVVPMVKEGIQKAAEQVQPLKPGTEKSHKSLAPLTETGRLLARGILAKRARFLKKP